MADGPAVRRAEAARAADCGHWLPVGGRYLATSGGRGPVPALRRALVRDGGATPG